MGDKEKGFNAAVLRLGKRYKEALTGGAVGTISSATTGLCLKAGFSIPESIGAGGGVGIILWEGGRYARRKITVWRSKHHK